MIDWLEEKLGIRQERERQELHGALSEVPWIALIRTGGNRDEKTKSDVGD